ncbi:Developmentally-regulated G-protein 1 (AtDRG1) (Developmentally-regulated G-protein 2A) (AtDRG2a) [Durusdinium trenchii]|uniref:Developmentally-regulated G-protein 1 (AtDRG1) (Developmentally-regulated G-protein 2A) (AtDRG2a) n=1 Tax=Durusdinium trenchii TaxID=1381693 RepID=A0ABP0RCR9_9DINO
MPPLLEKIATLELEISRTQKNKATAKHLGDLKAKLCAARRELFSPEKSGGGKSKGFEVQRFGDSRVALIGFPSVGKSSLLTALTGVQSEVAAYEFTTLTCIPGVINYNDCKIQLLDLPGIISGAAQGKGRGRQVIATARSADMILMILDATKDDAQRQMLTKELNDVGIRLNKERPKISVTKTQLGQHANVKNMTIVVCVVRGFVQTCFLTTSDTAVQDSRVDRQKRQELIYRQFTVAKQCMDETGQAMTDGPLEALHLAAQRCKDALETGDLQTLTASLDLGRTFAAELPKMPQQTADPSPGNGATVRPSARFALNAWRPTWPSETHALHPLPVEAKMQVKHMLHLALKYSNEALALEPDNVKAHFRRGCALEALERFRDAYFAYSAAFALDPADARIRAAFDRIGRYGPHELGAELKAQINATGARRAGTAKATETPPPAAEMQRIVWQVLLVAIFLLHRAAMDLFVGVAGQRSGASAEQMLIAEWVSADALQAGRFARRPFGPRRPPEMVQETDLVAPSRRSRKQKLLEEEEEKRRMEEEEAAKMEQLRREVEAEREDFPAPHLFPEINAVKRLMRQDFDPGHLVLRRWLKKGKSQGFVTVPFASALRPVVADPDVNICIVSRREFSDKRTKAWQDKLEELPLFDISGVVETPDDIDPLSPAFRTPLDQLPSHEELQKQLQDAKVMKKLLRTSDRSMEELRERATSKVGHDKVLHEVANQLPARLLTEEYRDLIRSTVIEVLMVMWSMHASTGSTKLRWRLTCTDKQEAPTPETSLRSIFLLAGEPLEFIPQQFVDRKKFSAEQLLSPEQIRRMDSEAWAGSLTKKGTNVSEAFKQVPPGWMTVLKGDSWPGMRGKGAVYRLPQFGKRVYVEVDVLEAPRIAAGTTPEDAEPEQESSPSFQSLGPLAGLAALLFAVARQTYFFKVGNDLRFELNKTLRALQQRPQSLEAETRAGLTDFEQRLWTDLEPDEAPVVLVVGSETETGQVVLRKLITSGYPCFGLPSAAEATGFPGSRSNVMKGQKTYLGKVPDSLYDAVAGVDKLVICDCDSDDFDETQSEVISNVLRAWQLYRQDFAEQQRAFNSKVQIFNFDRTTDFELWDLERQYPSDMCYGFQRAGWTRNSQGTAHFVGQFFEAFGQCQLRSPKLKLNFSRFGGLLVGVYNGAVKNKFSWFLRTSDFERTRVQFEFDFECEAGSWNYVRMPFNAFKAVRTDGVELPDSDFQLRREDVVQMGVVFRTYGEERYYQGDRMNFFSLAIDYVKAFKLQKEPQVAFVGKVDQAGPVIMEAEAETPEESSSSRGPYNGLYTPPKTTAEAVIESGLAFTMLRVKGLNEHPGGKFPAWLFEATAAKQVRVIIPCAHEDASIDDFIDVLEETGTAPRQYCKCIYVYNKIDLLNVSQVDELARQPYSVVVSVSKEFNLDGLLERIWQELDLRRVYTKKKGHFPDFTDPIVLTCQRGNKTFTVENAVGLLHKHGKKTGTTLAGGNTQVDPSGKKDGRFLRGFQPAPSHVAPGRAMRLFIRALGGETLPLEANSVRRCPTGCRNPCRMKCLLGCFADHGTDCMMDMEEEPLEPVVPELQPLEPNPEELGTVKNGCHRTWYWGPCSALVIFSLIAFIAFSGKTSSELAVSEGLEDLTGLSSTTSCSAVDCKGNFARHGSAVRCDGKATSQKCINTCCTREIKCSRLGAGFCGGVGAGFSRRVITFLDEGQERLLSGTMSKNNLPSRPLPYAICAEEMYLRIVMRKVEQGKLVPGCEEDHYLRCEDTKLKFSLTTVFPFHKTAEGVSANTVAVLPGGTEAISGGNDGTVWDWRIADGKPLKNFTEDTNPILQVAPFNDATYFCSVSQEQAIVWLLQLRDGLEVPGRTELPQDDRQGREAQEDGSGEYGLHRIEHLGDSGCRTEQQLRGAAWPKTRSDPERQSFE